MQNFTHFATRRIDAGGVTYEPGMLVDAAPWRTQRAMVNSGRLSTIPREAVFAEDADGQWWVEERFLRGAGRITMAEAERATASEKERRATVASAPIPDDTATVKMSTDDVIPESPTEAIYPIKRGGGYYGLSNGTNWRRDGLEGARGAQRELDPALLSPE